MPRIEETTVDARQGVTSRKHRVLRVLIISTGIAGLLLFIGAMVLV